MLAAAAACSRQGTDGSRMVEWNFNAVMTKATLDQDGHFAWSAGDRIAVWNATSGAFVPFSSPTGSGLFSATAPADARFTDCAVYPAARAVSVSAVTLPGSYASAAESAKSFPLYAQVEDGSALLSFRHLGALLSVPMTYLPNGSATLEIGSASHGLSGTFTLSEGTPRQIAAAAGSGTVRMPIPSGQLSFTAVIPVPTGKYPLSIRVLDATDTELFSLEGTDPITFERAHLYVLEKIEADSNVSRPISVATAESLEVQNDSDAWSHE